MNARALARDEMRIGGAPSVDLRPSSIIIRERDQSKLYWAILLFILVVLTIGAVAMFASARRAVAQAELSLSQAQLQSVMQAEGLYLDVREMQSATALLHQAAAVGTRHEIDWARVTRQLLYPLPEGMTLGEIAANAPAIGEPVPVPASALHHPNVGSITIVAAAPTFSSALEYDRAISALDIVVDTSIHSYSDGIATFTVSLSDVALTGRFVAESEEASELGASNGATSTEVAE